MTPRRSIEWPDHLESSQKEALAAIRRQAVKYLDPPLLPHFTDHSIKHSDRVTGYFIKLAETLQGEHKLNGPEWFIGISACILHDIAMHSSKHVTDRTVERLSPKDLLAIRERHGPAGKAAILESIKPYQNTSRFELADWDLGLNFSEDTHELTPYIAEVAGNHSGEIKIDTSAEEINHHGEKFRLKFLIHLVRLADSLDADSRRIRLADLEKWRIAPESLCHWWRHHYITSVDIDDKTTITITMRFPDDLSSPYIQYFCDSTQDYLMKEIKLGHKIFRDNNFHPYLEDIRVEEGLSESRQPPPEELIKYLNKIIYPKPQTTAGLNQRTEMDLTGRARLRAKWGLLGNPWSDLPTSFGEDEFVYTKNLENLFDNVEDLLHSTRGNLRIVFGSRGGGKSSFMRSIASRLRNRSHISYHDVGDAGITPLSTAQQLHSWMFLEIAKGLTHRQEHHENVPKHADLMKILVKFQGKKPVILIDNLDRYNQEPDIEIIKRFFEMSQGNLQALKHKALIIISATDEWAPVLSSTNLNYIGTSSFWHLEPFSPREVRQLINNRLAIAGSSYGKMFSEDTYHSIHKITQGNPREVIQTCSVLYERALNTDREIIDEELVDEVFGSELKSRIIGRVITLSKEDNSSKIAIDGLYGFHLAVERSGYSSPSAWAMVQALLEGHDVEKGQVPSVLASALRRIAVMRSDMSDGENERIYWVRRKELGVFAKALKKEGIRIAEFLKLYRLEPFPPPGTRSADILSKLSSEQVNDKCLRHLEKAHDLIHEADGKQGNSPVLVLRKVRFALEHILVAFLYSKGTELPSFYIEDHQEGHFENREGFQKKKSSKRMINELRVLLRILKKTHPDFLQTYREIKIIERNTRLYLSRQDGATLFNENDVLELRGAIKKIYQEFLSLISANDS